MLITCLQYFILYLETHPKKLQQDLAPIKYKWRQIREDLEISHSTIQSINRNPQYDDTLKLTRNFRPTFIQIEILQTWIYTNNPSNIMSNKTYHKTFTV